MKTRESKINEGLYILMCVISLGSIWAIRIIITQAIKMAFDD